MRRLVRLSAWLVAALGAPVALLAPEAWFDAVLTHLIGMRTHALTTTAQRATAAIGAATLAFALHRLASLPHGVRSGDVPRARWVIAAAAWSGLFADNVERAGAKASLWRFPPPMPWWFYETLAWIVGAGSLDVI